MFTVEHGFAADQRHAVARLFWQGFGGKLGRVMGPEARAVAFVESLLDPAFGLSAVGEDGELLGIAGFKTADGSFVGGSLADMAKVYGWLGGLWRGVLLELLERDPAPDVLLMDGVVVRADARGMGVGSALLDGIVAEAARRGLSGVRLDVIDSNPRARALYERKGFRATGTSHLGPLRHVFGFEAATTMVRPV